MRRLLRLKRVPGENGNSIPDRRQRRRLRRALAFAFPYWRPVVAILAITLTLAILNAAEPLVLKFIFDHLEHHDPVRMLMRGVALLIAIGIFREAATALSNWLTWHTRLGIHYSLLETTVERLHRMPLSFHRTEGVGAIMTKLDRGIQGFIGAITQILFNVFPAVLYLGVSIVVMMRLNWKLAVLVLCF